MAGTVHRGGGDPLGSWGRTARGGVDHRPGPRVAAVAPDAAVRARLNAALLDTVLVAAPVIVASMRASGTGWSVAHVLSAGRIALVLAVAIVYGTVLETAWGATLGKKVFGVRVVTLDGAAAGAGAIAARNLLRVLDALPLLYALGLLAMARSGPTRRQRLGDLAAGTTVLPAGGRRPLRTPRTLLPAAVLVSLALTGAVLALG